MAPCGKGRQVLPATVTHVRGTTRGELTDEDAVRDGFADLGELQEALARHYPGLGEDASRSAPGRVVCTR